MRGGGVKPGLPLLLTVALALLGVTGCRRTVDGEARVARMDADGIVIEVRSIANAEIEFGASEFTGTTDEQGVGTVAIPLQHYLQDKYSHHTRKAFVAVVKRYPLLRISSYHDVEFPMTPLAAKDVPAGSSGGPGLRLGGASGGPTAGARRSLATLGSCTWASTPTAEASCV